MHINKKETWIGDLAKTSNRMKLNMSSIFWKIKNEMWKKSEKLTGEGKVVLKLGFGIERGDQRRDPQKMN